MDIAGLLTATMDTLPAPEWQRIVAVRELAFQVNALEAIWMSSTIFQKSNTHADSVHVNALCLSIQVDIDLADTGKQSSRNVFAAEPDDEYSVSKEPNGEKFTSMPETAPPNSLLWECLHRHCSRNTMFTLLHCRAEQQLWQDSSLQPTCAAGDWQQQHAWHAQASTEQPHRYVALLLVLAAAWTLSMIMAWRCGAQSAHPSVDSRAVARPRHSELLSTFKENSYVTPLDTHVHSSGTVIQKHRKPGSHALDARSFPISQ